jgi:hypothetical protein
MSAVKDLARRRSRETLRPGVALPVLGYGGAVVIALLSTVLIIHPGPQHSRAARWGGGELVVVWAWALYKLGSNRIILDEDSLEVVSWGLIRTVPRGEVESAVVTSEAFSLSIVLADGWVIRPAMFLLSPAGMSYARAGLFPNAGSRQAIAARITEWSREARGGAPAASARRWRVRLNLAILAAASLVVAAEAISLTAANIW